MSTNEEQMDFLAVGDMVTDAFIKISAANTGSGVTQEGKKLCFELGDKVPFDTVEIVRAVGNSANAAVSATRLGLNSALISDVGGDEEGKRCLDALKESGVDNEYITVHEGFETNYHYVLWYEEKRTILVKHQEYPYSFPELKTPPKWMYLSSLAENSLPYHDIIAEYLKNNPDTNLAFQPGTFQMKLGFERLQDLYKLSKLFFCNVEEAKRILKIENEEIEIQDLLKKMSELGPEIVVITDGPNGAYSYHGGEVWFMPMYPDPKPPVDRTGAGDSFSSTFTSALALGKEIPEALQWGPINSMSVVQEVGAQKGLLERVQLEEFLRNAPEHYVPKKLG